MESYKIIARIIRQNTELVKDIFEMVIEAEDFEHFIPGQFINIYLDDKSRLLPRPLSISEADNNSVTIVYKVVGQGTRILSEYEVGREIKISSPLGNGYNTENYSGKKVALVAGGIGLPPMIGLAKELKEQNASVDVFLGFQSETFLCDRFENFCENVFISTDDGSSGFHGNVVDLLKKTDVIYDGYFSCGPKIMLKALSEYTTSVERDAFISVEERMGCGFGACVCCACKVMENGVLTVKSVCKHGPVFLGKDLVWDE